MFFRKFHGSQGIEAKFINYTLRAVGKRTSWLGCWAAFSNRWSRAALSTMGEGFGSKEPLSGL